MKKFVCSVCGYVFEGTEAPDFCPSAKLRMKNSWNRPVK